MMRYRNFITLVLIAVGFNTYAQQSVEQTAFDYFFNHIFQSDYKDENICKLKFSGTTRAGISAFGIFTPCIEDELVLSEMNKELKKEIEYESIQIDINNFKHLVKFKKTNKKHQLDVWKAIKVSNSYFVQITLSEKNEYTDAHFIEIGENGEVLNSCRTGKVW